MIQRASVICRRKIKFLVNYFGADNVFSDIPSEVEEHVVTLLELILIPLVVALSVLRNGQHGIEVHLVFGSVNTELLEAVIAEDYVLQIKSLKLWDLLQ